MFVGILAHDSMRDFGIEIERSCHRKIFQMSMCAVKKTLWSHLNDKIVLARKLLTTLFSNKSSWFCSKVISLLAGV